MRVFFTSPWIPAEWIRAHGLEPRGIWLDKELGLSSPLLSAGVCSFSQSVVHLAQSDPDSAVVFTTHCDQMRRGFDGASDSAAPRIFLFNLPVTWQTPVGRRIYRGELERLGRFLVELGGHSPSAAELHCAMTHYNKARAELLASALRFSSRDYAEAIIRFFDNGWVSLPEKGSCFRADSIPIALMGGPVPQSQWELYDVIEQAGGCVALNGTETGERSLQTAANRTARARYPSAADPAPELSDNVDNLVQGFLSNCVDVFQRPNNPLYAWLTERLTARNIRGIILWSYVGCDLWRAEANNLREAFGLPVLALDADEAQGNSMRTRTRIEAFMEVLR